MRIQHSLVLLSAALAAALVGAEDMVVVPEECTSINTPNYNNFEVCNCRSA